MRLSLAMQAVIAAWEAGEVPCLSGEPGVGKTDAIFAAAKKLRREVHVTKNLVMDDPTEFKGYGFPDHEKGVTSILPMGWAKRLNTLAPGVVFMDELGQALQSTMCATAPMFQADPLGRRRIGEMHVTVPHYFAAATNLREHRSCVQQMPDFFARRLVDVPVDFNYEDWDKWAVTNDIHPFVLAYGRTKGEKIHQYVPGKRCPLAASWTKVSKFEKLELPNDVVRVLIQGTIGVEAAAEYWVLREMTEKLPSLPDILRGKPASVPSTKALQYLVVCILATRVDHKTLGNALKYMDDYPGELRSVFVQDVEAKNADFATHDEILKYHSKYSNRKV